MFIGHYAAGFAIKKKAKIIPLWVLFLAVQLVDIFWTLLILLGIEKISYNLNKSVYLRLIYDYYPFTHSLFSILLLALAVYVIVLKLKDKTWALGISAAVLSHWFFDVFAHVKDMPLFFDQFKVGFGLWKYPAASLAAEILLFSLGAFLYFRENKMLARRRVRIIIFSLIISGLFLAGYFAPAMQPEIWQVSLTNLTLYILIALGAWWVEKE